MTDTNIIPAEQVSASKLVDLLREAGYAPKVDEDGDVRIPTEVGTYVYITLDERREMLKFYTAYRFRPGVSRETKLDFVNRLNDQVIFVRFSAVAEDILFCDYFVCYQHGLIPAQLAESLSWFSQVCLGAIAQYDKQDLVK